MQAFIWSPRFETGIASVDEQHRRLVDIVNRLGDVLIDDNANEESITEVFRQLKDYALFHFTDEERIWSTSGIDPRHAELHRQHHHEFGEQLNNIWNGRAELVNPAQVLHGFLSSWLTFHILEEDQAMARQIVQIKKGASAEEAYRHENNQSSSNSAILLEAMHNLYHVLSVQNKALKQANQRLEEKIDARTRELLQSEKMAAVGQLAAGVAHEINNPVGFVNSNLGTLRNYTEQLLGIIDAFESCEQAHPELAEAFTEIKTKADLVYLREDIQALLSESLDGLDRVKRIIQSLKDFAHADTSETVETDLLSGLESTLNVVWNEIKYKAEIVRELLPIPMVLCNPSQINQVFMNLLVNAAQAIETRGTITLKSGSDEHDVWISITDNGSGMPPEVSKHLFEPFFTTKPVGKGTGLGLSVSWDIIVNKHGGRIDVVSEPGKGTTFTIYLPAAT